MSNSKVVKDSKGHPKGLYLLFVTEMWERFSYYGMRALFMLYMVQALLFDKEMASQVYGSYTGLVYLTPLIGGYIADKYWGNRRSIVVGALVMALGQFLLFLSACYFHQIGIAKWLMFCGLGLLIMGNGFFKPNISTMVGRLYSDDDKRKDSAFTIFYMGVNVGSTLAPLICGLIGNTGHPEDFKWGFLASCIGMILGAVIFQLLKNKYICDPDGNPVGLAPEKKADCTKQDENASIRLSARSIVAIISTAVLTLIFSINWDWITGNSDMVGGNIFSGADWIGSLIYATVIVMPVLIITDRSLDKIEKIRIGIIYVIAFFVIFFWAAYEQAGASLTFFADEQTDRNIGGWEMPAAYFQSLSRISSTSAVTYELMEMPPSLISCLPNASRYSTPYRIAFLVLPTSLYASIRRASANGLSQSFKTFKASLYSPASTRFTAASIYFCSTSSSTALHNDVKTKELATSPDNNIRYFFIMKILLLNGESLSYAHTY